MALIQPQPCSCVLFAPLFFFSRLGKAAAAAAAAAAATCQACKARPELVSVSPSSLSFLLTICLAATKGGFRGSQVKGIWAHKKRGGWGCGRGEGRVGGFEGLVVTHWMCIAAPPTHSELLLRLVARPACAQRQADFKKQGGDHFTGGVPRFL